MWCFCKVSYSNVRLRSTHQIENNLININLFLNTSSVGERDFAEGRPWVRETNISPSSIGRTLENSVVHITWQKKQYIINYSDTGCRNSNYLCKISVVLVTHKLLHIYLIVWLHNFWVSSFEGVFSEKMVALPIIPSEVLPGTPSLSVIYWSLQDPYTWAWWVSHCYDNVSNLK